MLKHNSINTREASIADLVSAKFGFPKPHNTINDTISDEGLIEDLLRDPYITSCPLVKEWIERDRKKTKREETCEEEFDIALLKHLDENIRYDIIEFIPTFSKYRTIRRDEEYLESTIKFPYAINRSNIYRRDQPLVNFHKMRIISKQFNRRMMVKILKIENLFIDQHVRIDYILTILREQRKFTENGQRLSDETLYLYDDIVILHNSPQENSSPQFGGSTFAFPSLGNTGFLFGSKFEEVDDTHTSSTLDPEKEYIFGVDTAINSTFTEEEEEEEPAVEEVRAFSFSARRSLEREFTFPSGPVCTPTTSDFTLKGISPGKREKITHYYKNISFTDTKTAMAKPTYNFTGESVKAFVGENTTIKKIVFNLDIFPQIVNACKELKTLILIQPYNGSPTFDVCMDHLIVAGENEDFFKLLHTAMQNSKKVDLYSNQDISYIKIPGCELNAYKISRFIDLVKQLEYFRESILENIINTSIGNGFGFRPFKGIIEVLLQDNIEPFEAEYARDLLDYLFVKCNIPVEIIDSRPLHCNYLLQYLVYLTNTYHKGRLFTLSNTFAPELLDQTISFGWDFTKQPDEMAFSNLSPEVFERVSHLISSELLQFYSFTLNCSTSIFTLLLQEKVCSMLCESKTLLFKTLSQQIPAKIAGRNDTCSVPLLILVLTTSHELCDILLQEMEDDDLLLFEENDRGDSIFHLFANFCSSRSVPTFLNALSKRPHLVSKKNNHGQTPLDVLFSSMEYTSSLRNTITLFIKKHKPTLNANLRQVLKKTKGGGFTFW